MDAKVFLVEDEQSIITLVEYNLKKEGFKFLQLGHQPAPNITNQKNQTNQSIVT